MKHCRILNLSNDGLYHHLCGSKDYSFNEKSCCTRNPNKVNCPRCLGILNQDIFFAEPKPKPKKGKKKK